ncbi:DUF885 domain-containing protein [Hyphococcus flavus]|uniref:DUF885 domain-containing protein n=1 Tax=Hyphococcus flavus TaxID=1866326 RepID=A0AAE9ZCH8_9PROT|nr:DUF885 domain-containing protein [Hyphococcus flavus]WDI32224.1 DUF885 domain-containing protein [Hyphococcus flavus]
MKQLASSAAVFFLALSANALGQAPSITADGGFAATALTECKTDLRYLNQVTGWQVTWPRQWAGVANRDDGFTEAAVEWQDAPQALDALIGKLRAGIDNDETAPRPVVLRVTQQISDLASDLETMNPRYFSESKNAKPWNGLLSVRVAPMLRMLESFLTEEYLPAAKGTPGLSGIANGEACFRNAVEFWTTLTLTKEEIESIGRRMLDDARTDLAATARLDETADDVMHRLRDAQNADDTTEEELIAISQAALDQAHDTVLGAFLYQPPRRIVVEPMANHLQASAPAGYYRPPQGDGPAGYIINPSRPGERRLMAEVIAFHEGVPGHHLFFDYPRDRESSGFNAGLLEGWAIYAEYVADEMGLYSTTLDRQGMMTKHLWAASRLLVEPGLHLGGWTREDAIGFMLDNTVLSRTEIEIEVDRYIAMPGHSLSYMLGADLILTEREQAREMLGEKFDIKDFHDVVLSPGVRPLPQVRTDVRAWVQRVNE